MIYGLTMLPVALDRPVDKGGSAQSYAERISAYQVGIQSIDRKDAESSHVTEPISHWMDAIDVLLDYCLPADPSVPADVGLSELSTEIAPGSGAYEKAAYTFVRLWELGEELRKTGLDTVIHDAQTMFHELDLQANALDAGKRFHELTAVQQTDMLDLLFSGAMVPIDPLSPNGAGLAAIATISNAIAWQTWRKNVPYFHVRNSVQGFAIGDAVFSDAEHQISNPNVTIAEGGEVGAWNYTGIPQPLVFGGEELLRLAQVEAVAQPAASEAALQQLLAAENAGTIIDVGR